MQDPTHQEMFDFLSAGSEDVRSDIEEAIYWFANDYHGGQWSNLYSALCASEYKPGPIASAPSDPFMYAMLIEEYTPDA